uniref:BSD2 cysteine rich domain-containing protein n=1 Tax=Picea sitchensis TaxID=3332 RepID=A9NLC6_PICSI|nr:unknown [Picea sitchensis]ABR17166.1 unknown [Picea sitchensis]
MAVAPSSAFTGTRHLLVSDNPFKQKPQLPATKVPPAKHLRHNNIRVEQSLSPGEPRKRFSVRTKASEGATPAKKNSILCPDCDGNGMVACSQCKGNGVNSVDHFNGRFKAGATCWLCRGKRETLCGNCSGAGFMGGFMTTPDG